jgi:hypothetical protein
MDFIKRLTLIILSLSLLALSGCASVGPGTVVHDRFDYTSALADSWKQQMLINMVKLRYGDAPVFLDVASIISGYTLETGAEIFGQVSPQDMRGDTFGGLNAHGTFTDRPTITYIPLSGEKFARSLMKPLPLPALLSLIQAGYPIDLVLRICTHSVNGIRNRFGGSARARAADPEFYPLLERLRRIQDSGAIGLRLQKSNEMEGVVMSIGGKVDVSVEEDRHWVRKTLGLDLSEDEFKVVYGSKTKDDKEIAILSRSMYEIMIDLASQIVVPVVHVEEKQVNPTMPEEMVQGVPVPPLMKIYSSAEKPGNAFIAVSYQDYWFWIDKRDLRSKSLFSFLMMIFSLTETGSKEGTPILTIPAG